MKAELTKTEIQKIIERHIPYMKVIDWNENGELCVDIDTYKLVEENISDKKIYKFHHDVLVKQMKYIICPIIEKDENKFVVIFQ